MPQCDGGNKTLINDLDLMRAPIIAVRVSHALRDLARGVLPWFVELLKQVPDYELMFKMETL